MFIIPCEVPDNNGPIGGGCCQDRRIQLVPDDVVAAVVKVDALGASHVDRLLESVLKDGEYLEDGPSTHGHLVELSVAVHVEAASAASVQLHLQGSAGGRRGIACHGGRDASGHLSRTGFNTAGW